MKNSEENNTKRFFFTSLFILFGSLLLFSGCLATSNNSRTNLANGIVPAWYLDTNKVYPDRDYLAVRGRGSTEREAKRDAAGELATLFTAQINYDSTTNFRYSESENPNNSYRSVEQTVNIHSAQKIYGIEYSEPFRAEGRVYIVAYLERQKVGTLYSERIADRRNKITELHSRAQKFNPLDNNTEKLLSAFILYDYSVDLALRNQLLLEQLQIINKSMHERISSSITYSSVKLSEERSEFARGLSFTVNYDGAAELRFLGENIAEQFTKLGFTRKQGNNALVVKVSLQLSDIKTNNRYINLAWDLQLSFTQMQNVDGSGFKTSLLDFSKSGRESGISRLRTVTTLKRLLNKDIQTEFMNRVYMYFAKFAGV